MTTLPALVKALAEVDGRDRATLDYIARTIREAGYIATGKRGMGAAKMTVREAVNLLIALNGADTAQDAPLAIDRFRSLRPPPQGEPDTTDVYGAASRWAIFRGLTTASTFGEALEVMVEDALSLIGTAVEHARRVVARPDAEIVRALSRLGASGVHVTFQRYFGKIEFFHHSGGDRIVDFEMPFFVDGERFRAGFYGALDADRRVTVTVSQRTILAIWSALNPDFQIAGDAGGDPS